MGTYFADVQTDWTQLIAKFQTKTPYQGLGNPHLQIMQKATKTLFY